jgi:hypothetical protein
MPTPGQVFESFEEYMLPFNLLQCFDAFRLNTVYHVEDSCEPGRMKRIRACLDAFAYGRNATNLGELFDPYRERRCFLESMPPGDEITLSPMPSAIVAAFPNLPVAELVDNEVKRVAQYSSVLDDKDVVAMGELTGFAFGSYNSPEGRDANLHYVAANVSWKVAQYLWARPGPWAQLPLFAVSFPDMLEAQRRRILKAEIDPPFSQEELECFTDEDIHSFGASQQATYASPRCRHFMICPRCFVNLMHWQNSMMNFLSPKGREPSGYISY